MTASRCTACELGWEHCHGTLVQQPDGRWVCTDDVDCVLPPEAHEHAALDEAATG